MTHNLDGLTYPVPANIDHNLDGIGGLCPLDNGRHRVEPTQNLGALKRLPLELLNIVAVQLDLRSLTDFWRVNQRAMHLVDSIPQYKAIVEYAASSLRGVLSIGTAELISCQTLYDKLCTAECDICGDFGGYLYLVTCRRVCFLCFTQHLEYLPLRQAQVIRKFGLKRAHLETLPGMRVIPGVYSTRGKKVRNRDTLFDHAAGLQLGLSVHGTTRRLEQHSLEMASKKLDEYQARVASGKRSLRRPRTEDEFDGHTSNPRRFVAIVRAPFLDSRSRSLDWGFHCAACKEHCYNRPLHWRRKFNSQKFQMHIKGCGDIKNGKHMQQES